MPQLAEMDFSDFDVDREISRVTGKVQSRSARPEQGSYEWQCEEGALLQAWISWGDRIKEFRMARRHKEAPKGWFSRQQRRMSDRLCDEYGHWIPDGSFIEWRRKRLVELGRADEAKQMEGRMPWE